MVDKKKEEKTLEKTQPHPFLAWHAARVRGPPTRMRPACAHPAQPATTVFPAAAAAARRRLAALAGRRMGTTTAPTTTTARQLHASAAAAGDRPSTSSPSSAAMDAASAPKRRPLPAPGAPKVIILAGPTAVGKTAVSLALGAALARGGPPGSGLGPVEIINADSVQVYRGLDVGSDKAR